MALRLHRCEHLLRRVAQPHSLGARVWVIVRPAHVDLLVMVERLLGHGLLGELGGRTQVVRDEPAPLATQHAA